MKRFEHLTDPDQVAQVLEDTGIGTVAVDAHDLHELHLAEHDLAVDPSLQGINTAHLLGRVTRAVAQVGDADGIYEDTDRARAIALVNHAAKKGDKGLY